MSHPTLRYPGLINWLKAGIGIAVSVLAITIGLAVFFFVKLRKRENDASWNKAALGVAHKVDGDGTQMI